MERRGVEGIRPDAAAEAVAILAEGTEGTVAAAGVAGDDFIGVAMMDGFSASVDVEASAAGAYFFRIARRLSDD